MWIKCEKCEARSNFPTDGVRLKNDGSISSKEDWECGGCGNKVLDSNKSAIEFLLDLIKDKAGKEKPKSKTIDSRNVRVECQACGDILYNNTHARTNGKVVVKTRCAGCEI